MSPKDIVRKFYQSNLAKDDNLMDYFHERL